MEENKLLTFLRQTKEILGDFFPAGSTALLPVIFSSLVWAATRRGEIKKKILETKVWLEPETLRSKPAEFILDFFKSGPELRAVYEQEIAAGDLRALRAAFRALYPVLGLQDPFLERLFSAELKNHDYRRLTTEFGPRLEAALSEIRAAGGRDYFWRTLENICHEFLKLGWALLSEDEVREQLKKALEKIRAEKITGDNR
ncbi:MAG: hypothetical protein QME69_04800 [Candidatus Saccharicenans sp.]|nr:hypothetical protein [Candidatus Saccharicenans sp.]